MGKIIISEQRLNALINECINEVMLEEGIGQNVWNGIKKGAQAVGNGVKKFVKDPVGTAAGVKGWYDQTKNRMQSRWKEAYNIARDKVRLQSADDSVWDRLDPSEKQALLQVRGTDKFGNWKFSAIKYAKAVEKSGKDANEIAQIMTQKGFKGITPEYVQQMLAVGRNQTQTDNNNGEQRPNPDARNSVQQNNGGNYGMDSAVEEAVQKAINEVVSEVGDTLKGQYMLGRLDANRHKKAKDLNEPIHTLQKQHDFEKSDELRKKRYDLYDRSRHAFMKGYDERLDGPIPMLPSDPKRKVMQMSNEIGQDIERLRLKLQDIKKKNADRKNDAQEELNEIGNTWKGQEMLGRLSARREKQSGDERRKASMALDPGEEEEHRKKAADYMGRATAAFVKARDERDNNYNSWTKPAQMMTNAYYGGEKKGRREKK